MCQPIKSAWANYHLGLALGPVGAGAMESVSLINEGNEPN